MIANATHSGAAPPLITVIIPAFDAADTLPRAVASVEAAHDAGVPLCAVIVDDASRDDTVAVAQALARERGWLDVIALPANGGASVARNAGLRVATTRWVMFLDDDDEFVDGGIAALLAAAETDPTGRWWVGGWQRTLGGKPQQHPAYEIPDPVERIARGCPFSVHAGMVDREAVLAVGGFDPGLRTCEDWDLWLRLARAGLHPEPVDAIVGDYLVRKGSASQGCAQMLRDGLTVIDRGHTMLGEAARRDTRAAFTAFIGGLAIGGGVDDPMALFDGLDLHNPDVDPMAFAWSLAVGVPFGANRALDDWPVEQAAEIQALLEAFERRTGARGLARRAMRRLTSHIAVDLAPLAAPALMGDTLLVDVDLAAAPPPLVIEPQTARVQLRGLHHGETVCSAEIAPLTGQTTLSAAEQIGALVDDRPWTLVERLALPLASAERQDGPPRPLEQPAQVGAPALAEEPAPPRQGWRRLLAAVLGPQAGAPSGAYDAAVPVEGPVLEAPRGRVAVDLLALPARITGPPALWVDASVAGQPLIAMWLRTEDGVVDGGRLRQQLLLRTGLHLAKVALQAWLSDEERGDLAFEAWLRSAAERVDHARAVADPGPPPQVVPEDAVFPQRAVARLAAAPFDAVYGGPDDPWRHTSTYGRTRHEQVAQLLPRGAGRVLELGCADGHLTALLAPRSRQLLATASSAAALARTTARCAEHAHVDYRSLDPLHGPIPGDQDVIVASEALYGAETPEALAAAARRLAEALRPGGVIIAAHHHLVVDDPTAPGFDWAEQYGALGIERALLATGQLELDRAIVTPAYRVQRFRRRSRARLGRRRPSIQTVKDVHEMPRALRRHYLRDGGPPDRRDEAAALRLPILMYHRVAPEGSAALRRWRVTPAQFAEQLDVLVGAGFETITPEQWLAAVRTGGALPPQPILLTFDDGYTDFAVHAQPALSARGLTATVLAVSGRVGGLNEWDADRERLPLLGWDGLRDLASAGVSIGGHTRTHRPLTKLDGDDVLHEIAGSMEAVGEEIGQAAVAFAYPYGDTSDGIRRLAGRSGVELAFTCHPGIATARDDLLALPRVEVRGDRPLSHFVRDLAHG